jgi:hypothetical protein
LSCKLDPDSLRRIIGFDINRYIFLRGGELQQRGFTVQQRVLGCSPSNLKLVGYACMRQKGCRTFSPSISPILFTSRPLEWTCGSNSD